jgi:hypothetical protein
VAASVLLRVAEAASEGANSLVDEGGKWGAVVALEARMVQIVVPDQMLQKYGEGRVQMAVLVALEVVFEAAVAGSGAEGQVHEEPHKYERGSGHQKRWNESVAEIVQMLDCGG